jgi:DNA-directed RNA polymerase subunit M/transcription elongation factor TFIIS
MVEENDLIACPECGGNMIEDASDPELLRCENCGQTMSLEEAKAEETEEPPVI